MYVPQSEAITGANLFYTRKPEAMVYPQHNRPSFGVCSRLNARHCVVIPEMIECFIERQDIS